MATPDNIEHDKSHGSTDMAPVVQLYFFSVLDRLVDLAHIVSLDFIAKPPLYRDLTQSDADILGKYLTQLGTEPAFLGSQERRNIYGALFGTPGGDEGDSCESFPVLRNNLLKACARYTANIRRDSNGNGNKVPLEAEVETALIPFRQYLVGLQGGSVQWSRDRLTEVTKSAYSILQNPTVATVFGVSTAPEKTWPFTPDTNGNILVEQISGMDITRGRFGLLQQVALKGAKAIVNVIECDGQVTDKLISNCTSWNTALMSLRESYCETPSY